MMAAMMEDQAKKALEREEAMARSAAEREHVLLEELKALKSTERTSGGENGANAAAAQQNTPLSKLPLIAEIEAFEPSDQDADDDCVSKFDEWRELFDLPQYSLFADRYECLRIVKDDGESFRAYFQRVKRALRKFNFTELSEEQFSCLVALAGIRAPADEAARTAILQRMNADGEKVRYEQVVGDCMNLLKVREAADSSFQRHADRGNRHRRGGRNANN